ncbi:MAG: hypothetical protein RI953_1978 [Pseudomonadota bacterium]|jgi:hypothetical protein
MKIHSLVLFLLLGACKPSTSSVTSGTGGAKQTATSEQITNFSQADLQEFYEIVREFYLERAATKKFEDDARFEIEFFKKFAIPVASNDKISQFSKALFELIESREYGFSLFGIPKKEKFSSVPPKGMTSRDLEDFFQIVKTEYFKYVAGVQLQNFGTREIRFYARIQGLPPTAMPRQGDLLIISGDIFNKLETGK